MPHPAFLLPPEHLASLLHKLRGPLAAISAQAETLAEGILGPLSPPQAEAVRSIREELAYSLDQLEGLEGLWLHRPATDTKPTLASEVPGVVGHVLNRTSSQLENRQIHLQLDDSAPNTEHAPPVQLLQQLIQHLITCQTALVPKGTRLVLHLADMPANAEPLENDSAVETQLVRLEPLAFLLLQQAGNLIIGHVDDLPPALGIRLRDGWSCWISAQSALAPQPPVHQNNSEASSRPLILLADDQAALSSVLGTFLEDLGFRVEKASDGQEVIRMARQRVPNLIIMDLRMPVLNGIDAVLLLRQAEDPAVRAIPVICMSGLATEREEARCLAAGAQAFLRKPFRPAELSALLPTVLQAC